MTHEYVQNLQEYVEKAEVLVEALPYIKEFYGKTVVVKYGGSAMLNAKIKKTIIQDIALMKLVGMKPIVVHGGGPEISDYLKKLGKESTFINGLRVTDDETIEIAEMVLSGKLSKQIVAQLQLQGVNAVSISGKDGGLLKASKNMPGGMDIGFVGKIDAINPAIIHTLIDNDFVPVVSSIGADENGMSYNINADYAAVSIAGALEAEKLVFLTDVEGILTNVLDPTSKIPRIRISQIREMIQNGTISGGMIPKVECCISGVEAGVKHVHMLDGRIEHSLILEIFTIDGIGTLMEQ